MMTPLMILGIALSLAGVAIAIGITFYYISLPVQSSIRLFLDTTEMGIPYLVYFVILGAAISAFGLMIYIKSVRTGITVSAAPRYQRAPSPILRRPQPPRMTRPPTPQPQQSPNTTNVVEEIEKEIEEIIKSEHPPAQRMMHQETRVAEPKVEQPQPVSHPEQAQEEQPTLVEIVSKASDMVCPHCGSINPLGSTKCSSCGKPLFEAVEPSKSCPVCGAPLTLAQRISENLFVCGICFSELRIDPRIQKSLKLR